MQYQKDESTQIKQIRNDCELSLPSGIWGWDVESLDIDILLLAFEKLQVLEPVQIYGDKPLPTI